MKKLTYICLFTLAILTCSASCGSEKGDTQSLPKKNDTIWPVYDNLSDNQLMDTIQYYSMQYFWDGAEPHSGLGRERIMLSNVYPNNDANIVTTGGSGFGLMALIVGTSRGWISRSEAINRFDRILTFLESSDRYHGAWSHWINGETGKTKPFSTKDDGGDLPETAMLAQGLICVQEYFKDGDALSQQISSRAQALWEGIDFKWYQHDQDWLYWHWSPNYGWEMNMPLRAYNETLIAYILGASSPDYQITKAAWDTGWYQNGAVIAPTTKYGITLPIKHAGNFSAGGPLFWAHYSYCGFNPMITHDAYVDYKTINTAHVMLNRAYCIANPKGYPGYGESLWGLTSSYSPSGYTIWESEGGRKTNISYNPSVLYPGYASHNPDQDYGVISPTAALSSMPYAPTEVMKVARTIYEDLGNKAFRKYGPIDAFSMELDWFPEMYLAIDQGPIVCMIENYRTGLLWNLFMGNEEVKKGLDFLDITVND
ncbi:MAG: glucoamylase family protein [Bacteroidaceae bacterium]